MKKTLILLAVAIASPLPAQTSPYKLVILWGSSGVGIIDYPTSARCEAALAARNLECDPDEARWEDKLHKVVKPKTVPEKLK